MSIIPWALHQRGRWRGFFGRRRQSLVLLLAVYLFIRLACQQPPFRPFANKPNPSVVSKPPSSPPPKEELGTAKDDNYNSTRRPPTLPSSTLNNLETKRKFLSNLSSKFVNESDVVAIQSVLLVPSKPQIQVTSWGLSISPICGKNRGNKDIERADFVRNMAKHAWRGYMRVGAGKDEIHPIAETAHTWYEPYSFQNMAIDSMDTLWIMNLVDEYQEAKNLVLTGLDVKADIHINLFESGIRILGGLLAAYELDGDVKLLQKAKDFGDSILPAFNTSTGLPLNWVNLKTGYGRGSTEDDHMAALSEVGSLQLEMQYLSDVTGNPEYSENALRVHKILNVIPNPAFPGLVPNLMSAKELPSEWRSDDHYGIAARADSYYEYLLKLYISTGLEEYGEMFDVASKSMKDFIMRREGDNTYFPDRIAGNSENWFDHLTCFIGGWYSTGYFLRSNVSQEYYTIARETTDTCIRSYEKTPTGLGGDVLRGVDLEPVYHMDSRWSLRPELLESLFYMWRFTHDQKYRDAGWKIAQSIEKYCRVSNGYVGLLRPELSNPGIEDKMDSWLMAETLKYLYLLFVDDDVMPLEHFVFNTEAHAISIRGQGRRSSPFLM